MKPDETWVLFKAEASGMRRDPALAHSLFQGQFIHVPIELLAGRVKRLDPEGFAWNAVLAATGQPAHFE